MTYLLSSYPINTSLKSYIQHKPLIHLGAGRQGNFSHLSFATIYRRKGNSSATPLSHTQISPSDPTTRSLAERAEFLVTYIINLTPPAMISSTSKAFLSTMVRPCRLRAPSHTRIATVKQQARFLQPSPGVPAQRQFSQTFPSALPRKDSQNKDSINREPTEYSKSGTDDESARQEEAAFDPDITDPQQEMDKAGEGTEEGAVSRSSPHVRGRVLMQCRRRVQTTLSMSAQPTRK